MGTNPIDLETIQKLLNEPQPRSSSKSGTGRSVDKNKYPPPIEVGPLSYIGDYTAKCVSKRCGSPSRLKVNGASYCSTHAMYELNRIILRLTEFDWVINECNCKAGEFSKRCCHTSDCAVYDRLKQKESISGNS